MNVLGRMVGVGLLEFLRMLLSCKICAFGIILIHPGMAAECTAGNIVTLLISIKISNSILLYNLTLLKNYLLSFLFNIRYFTIIL